ncbi:MULTISPECIES: DUF4350 domain-containing protein [Brevibacillus]|jgi:hypothetical protein|uniref:DUF4350 domain-containing protein n=1 Tax=Brevibacillus borstelensis AK1 TaxID=1300222 RepID=M8DDG2_9BACL|nr:DUF4350 domain-containing protein [Brevibacillus borstelensis]EMT54359.1 hypothetical protein I532_02095 [Brevibacillus borstelensis AK1]KKX54102.1 hypothetical protein X546_17250 [Brevibacillus borstelensis cifa_chp40]MBE5398134.1 DUF4350 domain-containing protein [Brevibacillus borstelensis]MED1746268.1 DUF4350 domain-containing protein [Brevibacillus borstelensis]MED1876127.1 DUF4350 domain-containing protein [Brevibacillus borstelensis]
MTNAAKSRLVLGAAILLFLVAGIMLLKPSSQSYSAYVSFSPNPNGTKAVMELLGQKREAIKEWRKPTGFLPEGTSQAMLLVEPYSLQEEEQEELLQWVEKGNDLLIFQREPEGWEDADLSVSLVGGYESEQRRVESSLLNNPGFGQADTEWRIDPADGMEPLLSDQEGILAGRSRVGEGTVSLFLVPEWLTNGKIMEHNHFELIWPYLQGDWSVFWIDEYHHGYQQRPGILAIYPDWLIASLAQLAIALLLFIWWKGKRFGPVYTLREWTVRRGDETLLAISSWYERRRLAKDALQIREAYLRQLLADRWGLHKGTTDYEIVRVAESHWTAQEAGKLSHALARLDDAKKDRHYTAKRLVADSRLLDDVTKRLEKE